MDANAPNAELAGMDIYLLDQVLKERFTPGSKVLDAGCGGGRNLAWFARNGFEVHAVDNSPRAIEKLRADDLVPADRTHLAEITELPFADEFFDSVLGIAIFHLLPDRASFERGLREVWRVLKPGGLMVARLATDLSMEKFAEPLADGRHRMPGTNWDILLTSLDELLGWTEKLGAELLEPIKTVNVQNQRAMATWVMRK